MVILFVLLRTFKLNALPCKAVKSFRHAWAVIEIFAHFVFKVVKKFQTLLTKYFKTENERQICVWTVHFSASVHTDKDNKLF